MIIIILRGLGDELSTFGIKFILFLLCRASCFSFCSIFNVTSKQHVIWPFCLNLPGIEPTNHQFHSFSNVAVLKIIAVIKKSFVQKKSTIFMIFTTSINATMQRRRLVLSTLKCFIIKQFPTSSHLGPNQFTISSQQVPNQLPTSSQLAHYQFGTDKLLFTNYFATSFPPVRFSNQRLQVG